MKRNSLRAQLWRGNLPLFFVLLIPYIAMAGINLALSWLLQQVIDTAAGLASAYPLGQLAVWMAALILTVIATQLIILACKPVFLRRAMLQYKSHAFDRLSQKSLSAFAREQTAVYLSALTNDAASIETNYLDKIFTLVADVLMGAGALVMMLHYNVTLTLVTIALAALPLVVALLSGKPLAHAEQRVSEQNKRFLAQLDDLLSGFAVIKSFQAVAQARRLFDTANQTLEQQKCRRQQLVTLIHLFASVGSVLMQMGIFFLAALMATHGENITPGMLLLFLQFSGLLLEPVREVPEILANRKAANALIDKLSQALSQNTSEADAGCAIAAAGPIELHDLRFAYEPGHEVLHGLSATFEPGKCYAIVGASGSGKSTLLQLLQGAYQNYTGELLLSGTQLRALSAESVAALICSISQNVFIFNASIRDNITMFSDFATSEVDKAIADAGLAPLIAQRGEAYLCGENGCNLSGGERQRISIARGLLRKTPILLADEATASLDRESAAQVTAAILSLHGLTRIVVTHTLDAPLLRQYDQILACKDGRIAERGSFDALMTQKGYFYSLYTLNT